MDYQILYQHRFSGVDQNTRVAVWNVISKFITAKAGTPTRVLDPACGLGEFINSCDAAERWACDLGLDGSTLTDGIRFTESSFFDAPLPDNYFELIFLSNVLEHMNSQEEVNQFLLRTYQKLANGGTVIVMGPNFKFCADEYFDCADHVVPLTHLSVEEHLVSTGFTLIENRSKFLPFSFRSRLPASPLITNLYLKFPLLWKLVGKQFLIVARKETA